MNALDRGRTSFARQAWSDAYACLSAADIEARLPIDDLERFAIAAYLIGRYEHSDEILGRAHQESLRAGNAARAARFAFWLGFALMDKGEHSPALGWFARAERVLDDVQLDSVERGYLLLPVAFRAIGEGDVQSAYKVFVQAVDIGNRFSDRDLVTLAQHGQAQVMVLLGQTDAGMRLMDEAMVAVMANEVSPIAAGVVYCGVIEACQETFDFRRAQEWTAALSRWCDAQPDLVPYRGQCLVYRAEVMRIRGAWPDAMDEALHASERLSDPPGQPAVGAAFYQQAELHRLSGHFAKAEATYRLASQAGKAPQPGLALLRLAQGHVDTADTAIRRVLDEAPDRVTRARVLPAYVDIVLAANDLSAARAAANELSELASGLAAPYLEAVSAYATGAVLLAEGDARTALAQLRPAWVTARELGAPYEAARIRMLVGLACRALGDDDSAEMELDAARAVFQQLGAAPDLARAEELSTKPAPTGDGLTARELQVLALVATGKTNRAIATELFISERTVARHLSNIFTKLGLSSRSAATAYAYEHHLV